ncbi:MAG: glycosyltransferase N-terminal domain-containing protein [Chthoniobacteraceae bacterium]
MRQPLPATVRHRLWFYNLLFPVALLCMLPGLIKRMRKRGGYRENFRQRFGAYSAATMARFRSRPWIWIQSISVGETMLALKIARRLHEADPQVGIVISVTTSTGYEVAAKAACDWLEPVYNPIDWWPFVRRAVLAICPERFIIIEGMWPNLLAECHRVGAGVSMVARLSPRSARRFKKFAGLVAPFFRLIDSICVGEPEDVERWKALGVPEAQIALTGNVKYDEPHPYDPRQDEFDAFLAALGVHESAQVILGGSTFPGEEKILAETFVELRRDFPDTFLILVPRHFERTAEVLEELKPLGLRIALRTEAPSGPVDCLIINTNGELRTWYQLATLVFIGKSLAATGGQNPVEAALAEKPLLFGPHMENFQPIVTRWLEDGAVIQVQNAQELQRKLWELLASPQKQQEYATRALEAVAPHQGAVERVVEVIMRAES